MGNRIKRFILEDRGHITLAYFDIERTNILSPGGPGGAVQNIGSQFSDGVEVDGAFEITKDWNIGGNFAYTNANFGVLEPTLGIHHRMLRSGRQISSPAIKILRICLLKLGQRFAMSVIDSETMPT